MRATKTREVILALKKVREENGYTLQRIQDMVLDAGGSLSMSTVKKVFSEGSENLNFRYEDSVKPIADVLLRIHQPEKTDEPEVEALRQIVLLKNAILDETREELARTKEREAEIKADAQGKIDYLKNRVEYLQGRLDRADKLIDERKAFILRKDRIISILSLLLAICLLVIIAALIVDAYNPDIGFFWLEEALEAFQSGAVNADISQAL